jgi:hypothetical protein
MARSLETVLEESIELAEIQLEAARTLDRESLQDATAKRQDLLFELELFDEDALSGSLDDETRLLAIELGELDHRLGSILGAALDTFDRMAPQNRTGAGTYSADGRIRGGAR